MSLTHDVAPLTLLSGYLPFTFFRFVPLLHCSTLPSLIIVYFVVSSSLPSDHLSSFSLVHDSEAILLRSFGLAKSVPDHSQCPEKWFNCGNGRCISTLWQCDGDDDCGNNADEENCDLGDNPKSSHTVCPPNHFHCNGTDICIPDKWVCDGHQDCRSGQDEFNCTKAKSSCLGFMCRNAECIPLRWRCDDIVDCHDESDEHDCPINGTTHGHHHCTHETGRFLCSNGNCIDHTAVCDGKKDCEGGEDESGHCSRNCTRNDCSQGCFVSPITFGHSQRGFQEFCYCRDGYELKSDNKTCVDINECEIAGWCSHGCTNHEGSFLCSCQTGYKLDSDNRSCIVDGPEEPLMLFSNGISIRGVYIHGKNFSRYFEVHNAIHHVVGIDMDPKDKRVFWADLGAEHSGIYSVDLKGGVRQSVVTSGLKGPEDVAFDWMGENIYITDSGLQKIIVCKKDGSFCAILVDDVHNPRSITLDPVLGYMYWTEWGKKAGVYMSGMDGSERKAVASSNIGWPNGLTFDKPTQRIYWSDAKNNRIEYIDMRTNERHVLLQDTVFHPFSMAVFEDNLYWTDWLTFSLDMCNKFTGRNQTTILRENGRHMMGIHVYHPILYADGVIGRLANPCWSDRCSHICLIGPRRTFKCACPPHMTLASDNATCVFVKTSFLLVSVQQQIRKVFPEAIGKDIVESLDIPNHLVVGDYAYDAVNNIVYVFDLNKYVIVSVNLTSGDVKSTTFLSGRLDSIQGMTYDPYSRNLYWLQSNKGTLHVASIATKAQRELLRDLERPMDLALNPEESLIYIANLGSEPFILQARMDGSNVIKLIAGPSVGLPVSIFFHKKENKLFWADAKKGTIESLQLTESNVDSGKRVIVRDGLSHVMSIEIVDDVLYWTNMDHGLLYHSHLGNGSSQVFVTLLPGHHNGSSIKKIKSVRYEDLQLTSVEGKGCGDDNGGCSHICLLGSKGAYCSCPMNHVLDPRNDKLCINEKSNCNENERLCADRSECFPANWFCDGHADCKDASGMSVYVLYVKI